MQLKVSVGLIIILEVYAGLLKGQEYTQTIQGAILERNLQRPIEGTSIRIEGTTKGCKSDVNG